MTGNAGTGGGPPGSTRQLSRFQYRVARFKVRVTQGTDQGMECESDGTELMVGTARGNHLVLTDPTVSRHHFTITASPEGIRIRDLGSTNGTIIGGCRVSSGVLDRRATINVGKTTLAFETLSEEISEPLAEQESFGGFLGVSLPMRRLFSMLPKVADSDVTALIEGETGTGKSLLAEALHQESPRKDGPFVVVDCSAIPPSLMESELFGHEKGAFTGASQRRAGPFESADNGTVFLDEIGELSLEMQPKLLRVLEAREVRRVGAVEPVKVDVRLIAATNRDLREEVNKGRFRSDLWYRLNTFKFSIPPLRDRREDIAHLVRYFYRECANDPSSTPPMELVERMCRHDWPGNVRELRSAVERALLFDGEDFLPESSSESAAPVTAGFDPDVSFRVAKSRLIEQWESRYLTELYQHTGGNVSKAARTARMDRNYLRELLIKYGILGS